MLIGFLCLLTGPLWAAEEEAIDEQLELVIKFVSDPDREVRSVGLLSIREGDDAAHTERFAALLPDLATDGQVDLLDALGDRGDVAAKPAVMDMLKSEEQEVRAAALRAIGALGSATDVSLLADKVAKGSEPEKAAARQSLIRLRGDDVNETIVTVMAKADSSVRVGLFDVLAARNATEEIPTVLKSAEDPDSAVRLASLGALRFLADESHTPAIVKILKAAKDNAERRKAELTLLVICSRGGEACADAIIAGLDDANVPSRIVLLRTLARAGGAGALNAIVARLEDKDEAVRDEAARMLSVWSDPAAASHLLSIAKTGKSERHQVLAIRGLVRLASPLEDKPADLKMLTEAMNLAKRPQEKRLVIGVLRNVGTPEALALVKRAEEEHGSATGSSATKQTVIYLLASLPIVLLVIAAIWYLRRRNAGKD